MPVPGAAQAGARSAPIPSYRNSQKPGATSRSSPAAQRGPGFSGKIAGLHPAPGAAGPYVCCTGHRASISCRAGLGDPALAGIA